MLDFSLPYYGVLMLREHPEETLPAALPQGFSFCGWKPGMETEWAKLMARTEMMESFEKGLSYFREEFLSHPEELPANMLFVRSLEGEIIGTASLWKGACFGNPAIGSTGWRWTAGTRAGASAKPCWQGSAPNGTACIVQSPSIWPLRLGAGRLSAYTPASASAPIWGRSQ